jgi:hypothetical protein
MTPDQEIEHIQLVQQGQALLSALAARVKKREDIILSRLVGFLEAGTLSGDSMRDGIAGIATLRALIKDIERDTRTALDGTRKNFVAKEN